MTIQTTTLNKSKHPKQMTHEKERFTHRHVSANAQTMVARCPNQAGSQLAAAAAVTVVSVAAITQIGCRPLRSAKSGRNVVSDYHNTANQVPTAAEREVGRTHYSVGGGAAWSGGHRHTAGAGSTGHITRDLPGRQPHEGHHRDPITCPPADHRGRQAPLERARTLVRFIVTHHSTAS